MTSLRNSLKKLSLPLIALVAGFGLACLAAGVSSLFFVLLPITAFILGYFSSWRWGLLCGFLLFAAYTFAISVIWCFGNPNLAYPLPYIGAFIAGGFSIPLVGVLSPRVRKGVKKAGAITALAVSVLVTGLCIYLALPHYGYYYQVSIQSQENLENLEVYLPVGAISGEPYGELYHHVYSAPHGVTGNFTQEIVTTEYGKMLKLTIPRMEATGVPMPKYSANIIFWKKVAPFKILQLTPKTGVEALNSVTQQQKRGPVIRSENIIKEKFNIPVKIAANTAAPVTLRLENRTDRGQWINFAYGKSYPYAERGRYELQTDGAWVFLAMESTIHMEISGISD
jgi:hypothetical protein